MPFPTPTEPQKVVQDALLAEREDTSSPAHSDSIEKSANSAASSEAEYKIMESPDRKDKPRRTAPALPEEDHQQPLSLLGTQPLPGKEYQPTPSFVIDKEKIVPYPLEFEEEEVLPTFLTLEPDTVVPAPTDVADELAIISTPPVVRKEDSTSPSQPMEEPAERKRRQIEEAQVEPKPMAMEQKIAISSADRKSEKDSTSPSPPVEEPPEKKCRQIEEAKVKPKPMAMEQKIAIAGADRKREEDIVSIPPEIEEPHEFVILAKSDEEQPIRIPIWLEQGRPIPSAEKDEELQQIASIPKGKVAPTPSSPETGEEKQHMPVEIESPVPFSPETQKQLDQGMLDSALEFCQASNDFWEQGDLYNAIDALDQAYSLILKVSPEDDSGLLQQKDDLRFTISKRIIEVYSSRFTVANGQNSVIPLVINSHVERALSLFKGRERKFFLDSYRRSGRYRPAILRALKEAGLPEELSWLPLIESGFKVNAFSRSRALGLWQFIASTGYKFGLKRDRWVDERMDPEESTQAAIAYLKELHQIFGDWTTALAAYNCGEGKVLKSIQSQRINYLDNFWDLYERLPIETAFYVPKFLAVLHILKDPEAHGFTLPPVDEEVQTEAVTIDKQAHLKTIAKYTEVPYALLKELNPSLRYSFTPNRPFSFKMPKDKGQVLLSKLDDMPVWHPPVPAYEVHKVRSGDTLSVIARRYGTSVSSIMMLNGLKSSHFIRAGWRLKIPTGKKHEIQRVESSGTSGSGERAESVRYVVQKGDSLWRIAKQFGTTTKAIQSINNLRDTRLSVGQVLMMPQDLAATEEIATKTYIVSKGDSPYLIATRNHMKLSEFLRINNLSPRSTIFPGQELLVKAE